MTKVAIDALLGILRAAPDIGDVVATLAGSDKATVETRLERARAAIEDPIDTEPEDAAHRAELEAILRGDGTGR